MSAPRILPRAVRAFGALTALVLLVSCVDDGCTAGTYVSPWSGVGGARPPYFIAGSNVSSTVISAGTLADPEPPVYPCAPKPLPPEVPEGWIEYDDWSCTCPLYIPGSKDLMPKPIAWEPCPPQPSGIDCRSIVIDWGGEYAGISYGDPQFDLMPDGRAMLGIRRIGETTLVDVIAEIDGPVHTAILRTRVPGPTYVHPSCFIGYEGVNEGKYLFSTHGDDEHGKQSNHEGAIAGSVDDPAPTVLTHFLQTQFNDSWEVGAKWIVRVTTGFVMVAYPWDMSKEVFVTSPATDPEGGRAGQIIVRGDAIFWQTGGLKHDGINVWDLENGARPLIRWVGDYTKGAADLGTDGVDLVWAQGEKQPNDIYYAVNSLMTAPFTTDPAKLQPRRLRSLPDNTIGNRQSVVGCGYAAHHMTDDTGRATLVVRISDGVSWIVPHSPTFEHENVLGITCDEVFILGDISDRPNIMRVRLDSLGPGIPPD